jgi:erythromycin esterase-like protein
MSTMNRVMLALMTSCVLLSGCATWVRPLPDDALRFLRDRHESLVVEETGVRVGAALLGDAEVYLLGEAHGVAANETIDFALLTYLYETAGMRTYLTEAGYSAGRLYDSYIQTGDRQILNRVFSSLQGTSAWNNERYEFWERLAEFNTGRAEADRVRVLGLDVEHQYAVGIGYLSSVIPEDEPPRAIRGEIETIRTIVEENGWSAERCRAAADALDASIAANHDLYAAYFGDRTPELIRALDSVLDGFAYRSGSGAKAENARDRSMYERFIDLAGEYPGPYYGKLGAEHIHQRSYRGLQRFGSLIDGVGSPFSDRVASILMSYDGGTRLARGRDGSWEPAPLESPSKILRPLTSVTDPGEKVILFRLTGAASPMSSGLYLLEAPSGGGVTTDYIQYIVLIRDAGASTPFDARSDQ